MHYAELVRAHAPNLVYGPGERQLPVDYRRCRRADCADAADDRDLDAHRTQTGERATVFTRVIRRHGRVYIQHWFYLPDSKTTVLASDKIWEAVWLLPQLAGIVDDAPTYLGLHRDDWESFQVRIDPDGAVWIRASSHGHYQGCKWARCRNRWFAETGWTRVSRGSHAGHIPTERVLLGSPVRGSPPLPVRYRPLLPGHDLRERTTTGEGLWLIPLETQSKRNHGPLEGDLKPRGRRACTATPRATSRDGLRPVRRGRRVVTVPSGPLRATSRDRLRPVRRGRRVVTVSARFAGDAQDAVRSRRIRSPPACPVWRAVRGYGHPGRVDRDRHRRRPADARSAAAGAACPADRRPCRVGSRCRSRFGCRAASGGGPRGARALGSARGRARLCGGARPTVRRLSDGAGPSVFCFRDGAGPAGLRLVAVAPSITSVRTQPQPAWPRIQSRACAAPPRVQGRARPASR